MSPMEPRSSSAEYAEAEWMFAARGEVLAELTRLDLERAAERPDQGLGAAQGVLTGALLGGLSWALLWLVGTAVSRIIG